MTTPHRTTEARLPSGGRQSKCLIYSDLCYRLAVLGKEAAGAPSLDVGGYCSGHHSVCWSTYGTAGRITVNKRSRRRSGVPDVWGDGRALPFADRSFPLVMSSDVLEHVPEADRPLLVRECARVASAGVALLFPVDSLENVRFEADLAALLAKYGCQMPGLCEHRLYGLPSWKSIVSSFDATWNVRVSFVGSRAILRSSVLEQITHPFAMREHIADGYSRKALVGPSSDPYRVLIRAARR